MPEWMPRQGKTSEMETTWRGQAAISPAAAHHEAVAGRLSNNDRSR